jgi:hypothetical protein
MPAAHERAPEQARVHWSPEQVTRPAQLSPPSQTIRLVPALLLMVLAQDEASAQVTEQSLPPHRMGPAQELAWLQVIVQAVDLEQSIPPWQPEAPQLTWQGCSGGQTTAVLQAPGVLRQSNVQAVGEYCPPALIQRDSGVAGGEASTAAPPVPTEPPVETPPVPTMPPVDASPPVAGAPPVEDTPPVPTEPPVEIPPLPIEPPVPTIPPVIDTPPVPGRPPSAGPPSRMDNPPVPGEPPEETAPPVWVPPPPARGASMAPPPPEAASTPDAPPVPERPPWAPRSKAPLVSRWLSIGYTTAPPLPSEPALPSPALSTLQPSGIRRVAMSQYHVFGLCIAMNLWLGYWSVER